MGLRWAIGTVELWWMWFFNFYELGWSSSDFCAKQLSQESSIMFRVSWTVTCKNVHISFVYSIAAEYSQWRNRQPRQCRGPRSPKRRFELALELQRWTRARSKCLPEPKNYSYATEYRPYALKCTAEKNSTFSSRPLLSCDSAAVVLRKLPHCVEELTQP